ncbi:MULTISPECIES: DoxX family protein [Aeromicrobium]|uniref:DoxX family protein n=1 Tax=Aeromicrobium TaxID=2040 RepID=UPI002579FA4B|nr:MULTISPECIES: MauE/DoxX family redox-associated membrane protein [Aeromicrobium]
MKTIGRILLGGMLAFAGIGHLTFARDEFDAQVPNSIPLDEEFVVVVSGIVEIALGAALMAIPRHRRVIGLVAAAFFVAVFPGNVSQYLNGVDAFGLDSDRARLARLFFQPVLVVWALWSTDALELVKERRRRGTAR